MALDSTVTPVKLDGFLKIDTIPGESERSGHEGELEIYGVSFKMEAPFDSNTMSRRGRISLSTVTVFKNYDKGSPYLKQALFLNSALGDVIITARRTIEEASVDYLKITLTKATVARYEMRPSSTEPDLIEEEVALAFSVIEFAYGDETAVMDVHVGL